MTAEGGKKNRAGRLSGRGIWILFAFGLLAAAALGFFLYSSISVGDPEKLQKEWVARAEEEGILGNTDGYDGAVGTVGTPENGRPGDRDGDGVPDPKDILLAAKEYVKQKPSYESRYYPGGWPDDGYGVCADVVAFAFLEAGYDLQALVDMDARWYPSDYPRIDRPDPNIDFRRVANLQVYFAHTAESLTLDPDDTDAWKGGDVVIFPGHIGIVSDKTNARGVHFVLHHASPAQVLYEEDILHLWEITGHYRVN